MAWIHTFFYVFVFILTFSFFCLFLLLCSTVMPAARIGPALTQPTPLLLCYLCKVSCLSFRQIWSSLSVLLYECLLRSIILFLVAMLLIKVQLCEAEAAVALRWTVLAGGIISKVFQTSEILGGTRVGHDAGGEGILKLPIFNLLIALW